MRRSIIRLSIVMIALVGDAAGSRAQAPVPDGRVDWSDFTPEERVYIEVYERVNRSVVNITTKATKAELFFLAETPVEGAGSGSVIACVRAIGVICQDSPHLSLHHPHALSWPPFPTMAFQ